jgi:hypothetical protein
MVWAGSCFATKERLTPFERTFHRDETPFTCACTTLDPTIQKSVALERLVVVIIVFIFNRGLSELD